jgi:hypothetical protein
VVCGIALLDVETSPKAKGGDLTAFSPWLVEDDRLSALAFEYRLPI